MIFYFVFSIIFLIGMSAVSVFHGGSMKTKAAILSLYAGYILTGIYLPFVFRIMVIIFLIVSFFFGMMLLEGDIISRVRSGKENKTEDKKEDNTYRQNREEAPFYRNIRRTFFEGMNTDEAKSEYRKLMKHYHPDNPNGGDPEMAKKIAAAYMEYRKKAGS